MTWWRLALAWTVPSHRCFLAGPALAAPAAPAVYLAQGWVVLASWILWLTQLLSHRSLCSHCWVSPSSCRVRMLKVGPPRRTARQGTLTREARTRVSHAVANPTVWRACVRACVCACVCACVRACLARALKCECFVALAALLCDKASDVLPMLFALCCVCVVCDQRSKRKEKQEKKEKGKSVWSCACCSCVCVAGKTQRKSKKRRHDTTCRIGFSSERFHAFLRHTTHAHKKRREEAHKKKHTRRSTKDKTRTREA